MLTLLVIATLVTIISLSLINLMNTDMTQASIQNALAQSFYIAQAGLEEAKAQLSASADPSSYATPDEGITAIFGGGEFTFWVSPDAGPVAACGDGFKTIETAGRVAYLGRTFTSRLRACGVAGAPMLAALFAVSQVEFAGASRTYLAPYQPDTPGGGASVGSLTQIDFASSEVRVNALSQVSTEMVSLRDGTFADYTLFGFSARPQYNPAPSEDATPWVLGAVGDLIKGQPAGAALPNPCGTPLACVTVANRLTDVAGVAALRATNYMPGVYVRGFRTLAVPAVSLGAATFQAMAAANTANADLNARAGWKGKRDSRYTFGQISRIFAHLASRPTERLHGTVYVDGSLNLFQDVNLGGPSGDVTLVVGGDLIIPKGVTLTNLHDLTTVSGRRLPAIVVLRQSEPGTPGGNPCTGGGQYSGSGRFVMCGGSRLVVDGLVYTQDGMAMGPGASVDQIGAMYHNSAGTGNVGFATDGGDLVIRFDPLALGVFDKGIAIVSWQQLPGQRSTR